MPDPIAIGGYAVVLFALSLTPGPSAAYCIAIGIEDHDRSAVWAPVGVSLGKSVHLTLAAVGATWITELPAALRNSIIVVAGLYLVWQGYRHWTQRAALADHSGERSGSHARHVVVDGFLVAVANPESLASSVAVLPLFVDGDTRAAGLAVLVGVGTLSVLSAYLVYESVAVTLAHRLTGHSQNRIVGATYLAAATGLAVLALV
ncbi:MAG: LysE family transporter [Acidimicrobiia bacterium]|nr:LysE family transporter [Acidimicrobiia bacterium]